jgi:signal transduction histidine kinase/DNA-binding response OmpR family regulator
VTRETFVRSSRCAAPACTRLRAVIAASVLAGYLGCAIAATEPVPTPEQTGAPPQVELSAEERAWLKAHPVIRVGAETNYAPYEFQDKGQFVGVVADYLELAKKRLGLRFQVFQLLDFEAIEDKLRKRELDVVMALTRNPEREEFLSFTKPYLHYVNVIVTRDDFGFVSGMRDFPPGRVAVVKGHSSQTLIQKVYPGSNVPAYADLLEGLLAVSTGQTDGLVDDIFPIVYNIRSRQIGNLKIATQVERPLQPQGFSIGVRSDWPQLVAILDKLIETISEAEQREISQKWLSLRYESKIDYRAIWTALAIFAAILVTGGLYIRQLSRQRRALMAARAEAEAANRSKDQFLASISHELRTPLHAILGYADLLRQGHLPEPARQQALATIGSSGGHLLGLIEDLLDLSRIRSGRLELSLAPVQLPALLDEVAAMMRVRAEDKGLAFVLDVAPDLPAAVSADGKRLRQIFLNLLGNAIKFTDAGEVLLRVRAGEQRDGRVRLQVAVEDTGMGIPPEERERIFQPFEQAEQGRRQESGVGLGLAISQELVRLMGGEITVDGRPEGGSRFDFAVTLTVLPEQRAVAPAARRAIGYIGARRRILVADDQAENRELLRQMLEPLGFEITLASDGGEVLAAARAAPPALVLMDLRMPRMDGFHAAAAIHRLPGLNNVPVVAASASTADLTRARAEVATFAVCLRKPFQSQDLMDTLQRLLGLTWRYEDEPALCGEPPDAPTETPSPEVLEELLELTRLGKLVRVEQVALELGRSEPGLAPFASRVHELARGFEEGELIALLERAIARQRDAVGH